MKNKFLAVFAIFLSVFSIISCQDNDDPAPTPTPTPTPAPTYFIEGKVNGIMHRAEYVCSGCGPATGNYDAFMNWITMQRTMSATDQIGWDIHIMDVTLDSWHVPDTLNATAITGNEQLNLSYYKGPWQSDNNYLVDGTVLGDNSFIMYVTSKAGDIIEGTFSGTLRNGSNSSDSVHVTEGKFKVKIVRQ
jgi:hypothetical protein